MENYIKAAMKRFNYLTTEIDAAYHEAALKLGLSDSAMLILYAICNSGDECPLSDIPHLSGISKQTVNSALRKLEHEGARLFGKLQRAEKEDLPDRSRQSFGERYRPSGRGDRKRNFRRLDRSGAKNLH